MKVVKVEATDDKKGNDVWYNVHLENGMIYRRSSSVPLDWEGKIKEFIIELGKTLPADKYEEVKENCDKYSSNIAIEYFGNKITYNKEKFLVFLVIKF